MVFIHPIIFLLPLPVSPNAVAVLLLR
jgi:hypothetical protein